MGGVIELRNARLEQDAGSVPEWRKATQQTTLIRESIARSTRLYGSERGAISNGRPYRAFPETVAGRLLHHYFRGRLSVHSRYGLHARQVA